IVIAQLPSWPTNRPAALQRKAFSTSALTDIQEPQHPVAPAPDQTFSSRAADRAVCGGPQPAFVVLRSGAFTRAHVFRPRLRTFDSNGYRLSQGMTVQAVGLRKAIPRLSAGSVANW